MKFRHEQLAYDETELSIKRIIEQCVRKCNWFIVCVLFFAIAVTVFFYVTDLRKYNLAVQAHKEMESTEVESTEVEVTEIELTEIEQTEIKYYLALIDKVDQLEEYLEKSVIMNVDFENIYLGTVQYYVETDKDIQQDVIVSMSNYVYCSSFLEKFSEPFESLDYKYAAEIVGTGVTVEDNGILLVHVWAATEEDYKEYVAVVKDVLKEYSDGLKISIGDHKLVIVHEEGGYAVKNDISEKQRNTLMAYRNLIKDAENYYSTLTDDQKIIINHLQGDKIEEDEELNEKIDVFQVAEPRVELKWLMLGCLIGMLIYLVCICLMVLFDGKMQAEEELYKRFDIIHFGSLSSGTNSTLNKVINKIFYPHRNKPIDVQVNKVYEYMKKCLVNMGVEEVELVGSLKNFEKQHLLEVCSLLEKENITCKVLGNMINDDNKTDIVKRNTVVILVEIVGKSKVKDIYKEVIICNSLNKKVAGYISLVE